MKCKVQPCLPAGKSSKCKVDYSPSDTHYPRFSGFTLIELIVAIGLFGLISLLAGGVYLGQIRLFNRQNAQVDIVSQNQIILDDMVDEIRNSSQVASGVTVGSDTYASGTNQLVLRLISIDSSGQLLANSFDHLIYYLEGSSSPYTLHKRLVPDASSSRSGYDDVKSADVSSIIFSYSDLDFANVTSIDISLTTVKKVENKDKTLTTTTKAILRNY
ncbi:MAG TPA: type II secretion system protein [Patescibacteria group bacterium]